MTTMRDTVSEPVPFEASDFLNLDRLLSDEERTVREEVNGFVREKIKPYVRDWWEKASFPQRDRTGDGSAGIARDAPHWIRVRRASPRRT
ncbi:MAG TPA: acyl-CoA dehydrogenase family protein [Rubrobacteraceae bacterium]|nr:acyl-CoA dehydrogenase family protein [Rubrobacteraceae bacterium]